MNSSRKARWLTIFLVAGIVLLGAVSAWAQITEVWVDDDYTTATPGWGVTHFEKIQDGVNGVADDGTVHVANGNYNAASSPFVRITKPLTLIGESRDGVILDGTGTSTIAWAKGIHVTANDVSMKNLTVQNFGAPSYWGYGVLFRDYAHDTPGEGFIYYTGCVAENVKSQNNCYPMYAFCNQNLTVHNCLIQNNLSDGMFIAKGSSGATITDNTVLNSGDHGIWVGGAGWCGPSCPNATITNNYVDGAREGGISFVASDGALIAGNTITNVAGESPPAGWSVGALSLKDGSSNVEAYNNTIYNNNGSWGGYNGTGNAIGIDGIPLNINLHDNTIYGNTGYGCYNASSVVIDASSNWWGTTDPTVVAGLVSSLVVDFTPMLNSGVDGDPVTPGWQPDLSSLTVHTLGQQVGTTGRIQEGIDLVTGSTVHVAAGSYQESLAAWKDLEITKSVDVVGAGSGSTIFQLSQNNANGVEIRGTDLNVLIEGMAFTRRPGNTYASDFNLRVAETPSTFDSFTLRDVEVAYARAQGVSLGKNGTFDFVLVDDCYFHDNLVYGLYSRGIVTRMIIRDSTFENHGGMSIILDGQHDEVTLDNVEVSNSGNYSLSLGGTIGGISLNDCYFHDGGSYLIYANADIDELAINDSRLIGTSSNVGVDFEHNTTYGMVIFNGTEVSGAASTNIRIKPGVRIDELVFDDCNVYDAGNDGVSLWGQADKTTITNSHFDNNAGRGFDFGHFQAAGTDITVTGSTFDNNTKDGIGMANSQGATFVDVIASGNGGAGFVVWEWVDSSSDLSFETSTFAGNSWDGMVFVTQAGKSIDGVSIRRCTISGNAAHGVEFWRYDGGTISNAAINLCSITGNGAGVAVVNPDGTLDVDGTLNWWGDAAGPSGEGAGAGDSVSTNVIYSPWLGIDPDGNPTLPGVQITGPMLIIVAPVGPEPASGYLNAAIAGANSPDLPYTDTIQVQHGTYNASTPITDAVNLISQPGSALHTTLNGNMNINGNGVLVGLPMQGFRMNGNVTVDVGANAATSRINWCDVYGNMTNSGTGTFDAQYNYWGTLLESVVDSRTTGAIDYEPFLPKNADDSYVDATAIMAAGLASGIDPAIDQLWLMVQLGQDVSTFIQYQGVAGAGAFGGAPVGAEINLGGAAGGGGAVEGAISGTYTLGEPIDGRFTLTDPVTGEPITDAAVTTSLLGPDGALVFWGCAIYDETTGEYVFTIDTSGLAPGTYELIIQTDDGQSKTVSIEVLAA